MGTPAKKRKLNDSSKASPAPIRNLDFFFGNQINNDSQSTEHKDTSGDAKLTDEQLARKLQAEWNQEEASARSNGLGSARKNAISPRTEPVPDKKGEGATAGRQTDESGNISNIDKIQLGASAETTPVGMLEQKTAQHLTQPKSTNTLTLQSGGSAEDTITSNIPFDQSPLIFEPSKYVADLQKHWATEGGNASYALLTRCFVLVNSTHSRIKIVDTLVNLLRVLIECDPSSLLPTVCSLHYTHITANSTFLFTIILIPITSSMQCSLINIGC